MNWTNGPMDCWIIFAVFFGPFFGPFAETFFIEILREEWLVLYYSIMNTHANGKMAPELSVIARQYKRKLRGKLSYRQRKLATPLVSFRTVRFQRHVMWAT